MDEVNTALASFLKSLGDGKKSFWYLMTDECAPVNASPSKVEAVDKLSSMGLRRITNLNPRRYLLLLKFLGLVKATSRGIHVQGDFGKHLLKIRTSTQA